MAFSQLCVCLLVLAAVNCLVLGTGKAYYCRDPETGKLHAVNSTWESSTFCGNYTCKIRKRNHTETEYAIRQINITNIPDNNNTTNETTSELNDPNKVDIKDSVDLKVDQGPGEETQHLGIIPVEGKASLDTEKYNNEKPPNNNQQVKYDVNKYETEGIHKTGNVKQAITDYYQKKVTNAANANNMPDIRKSKDDRFLTEQEINAISDILHSVKRSELDAIVDIYNLAQEIYNEMDTISSTPSMEKTNDETTNIPNARTLKPEMKSYWYDPYYKGEHVDAQGTSQVTAHSTTDPKQGFYSYFTGSALADDGFRRIPYHYTQPNQRSASYFVEPTTVQTESPKPCKKHMNNVDIAAKHSQSYLLPYPFAYIHQYHLPTDYPKGLLYDIPYTWDYYNRVKKIPPYSGYMGNIAGNQNAVLINPHLQDIAAPIKQGPLSLEPMEPIPKPVLEQQKTLEHIKAVVREQDLLRRLIMKTLNKDQDWQTQQLSNSILSDVRKTNHTRFRKSQPLTKKITLENVGKVLNIDHLSRKRRSAEVKRTPDPMLEEEGTYETYLERTTCQNQTVPGFFRVGNLTEPFPACCPQLIRNR